MSIGINLKDFSNYEFLPFSVLVTQDWKILYFNQECKKFFQDYDLTNKDLRDFLSEEDRNFFKFHFALIPENKIQKISTIFEIGQKKIPVLLSLKLFKDIFKNCYFIITIQQIEEIKEKFSILSKIVLETFTLYGEKLYQELLDKITNYYELDGAVLYIYSYKDTIEKNVFKKTLFYSVKKEIDLNNYEISEKLLKRIQKYGAIIVQKDFQKYYPEDRLNLHSIQSFIGIKVQLSNNEDIFVIVFSSKEIQDASELHFALNVCSVKIISEYLRIYQYQKYERLYRILLNTNDAVFIYDIDADSIFEFNPAFCKLLGFTPEEIKNRSLFDLYDSFNSVRFRRLFYYYYKRKRLKNLKFRFKIKNKNGFEIPVEVSFAFISESTSNIMICVIRDLTFAVQAIEEHKKYLQTLSLLNLHVIELDNKFNILYINYISNSKLKKININSNFLNLVLPDYQEYIKTVLNNLFKKGGNIRIRFPVNIEGTRNDWYEGDFVLIKRKKNKFIRGILKDITIEYITEKQSILLAESDLLTSLPNRNRLEEDLFKAILRADRNHTFLAVGFLDLDKFYHVNEFIGHRLGDLVLSIFAERLRLLSEISYSTYRWGGDQFVFIIENLKTKNQLFPFIEKLKQLAKEPFNIEGEKFYITFSVGIAIYPLDGMTIDTLFGEADKAMNYAKNSGRFQVILANSLPKKTSPFSKLEIQSHILQSIADKKIESFYQPIYDLEAKRIVGMESLARLNQMNKNIYIGPDIFIPLAEDLGLIEELSYYIIYKSFEFLKKLLENYDLYLSVNISRRLLHSDFFIMNLFDIQKQVGVDPSKISLEITETLAMFDKEANFKKLIQLKEMGYKIAIDDFGTGYSALGYLQELPIDVIKIDKIFLKKLKKESNNRILEAIVSMCKALNLEVVAEGVEDYETIEILKTIGIRYVQGYFYAPPLSSKDFEEKIYNDYNKSFTYLI